jgi:eukaryotic-like serine/threonine-protein kinase
VAAKLARFSWLPGGLAAALVIVAGRSLFSASFAPIEFAVYDRVAAAGSAPSPQVAIVAVDEASIAKLGEWPWSRAVHASLLDKLRADGARVVGFTFPMNSAPRTNEVEGAQAALALLESSNLGNSQQAQQLRKLLGPAGADANARFAAALRAHGGVVLPVELRLIDSAPSENLPAAFAAKADAKALAAARHMSWTRDPAPFAGASAVGHTYLEPDVDRKVRTDFAAMRLGDTLLPSLATAVAARALNVAAADLQFDDRTLHIGPQAVNVDSQLRTRPRYFAASGSAAFATYPYWQVLAGEVPAEQLKDKVVLVGRIDMGGAADSFAAATPAGDVTPSVVVSASALSSLLTGTTLSRPTSAMLLEWAAAIGVVLLAAFALPAAGFVMGAVITGLVVAILLISELGMLSSAHLWARFTLPCIAAVAGLSLYMLGEFIRRANVKAASSKDPGRDLRSLGQTFQQQGQLDLAFETYRRCPLDAPTMDLLYQLGLDFERRRQLQKAAAVYTYISARDPNYRDLRARRARIKDEPATRPVATPPPPPRPSASTPSEWDDEHSSRSANTSMRMLGRYEIERELGKGAMGVVYLGRDPKINRVVAIKAIPLAEEFEEDDLAEARARFFREAEMAGRLNHPAIVTVYDAGEDQGLAYIAMEYLRGQHLSHFADSSRLLPPRTVMLLAARVAEALHYAHRQNVVHRDIKPANIMFNPDTDELKITDFGIARLTDTSRTKTGIVLGTPSFMSPEQLEGRPLDGRSDQFALGVSLYQLLCGQLPFRAESMPRLMHKIATEPHASVRLVRPDLPAEIDGIVDRTLAKAADDRYEHCGALAVALRACAGSGAPAGKPAQSEHEWLIP